MADEVRMKDPKTGAEKGGKLERHDLIPAASLRRDRDWVERAREAAFALVDADPGLAAHEQLRVEMELILGDNDTEFLLKS